MLTTNFPVAWPTPLLRSIRREPQSSLTNTLIKANRNLVPPSVSQMVSGSIHNREFRPSISRRRGPCYSAFGEDADNTLPNGDEPVAESGRQGRGDIVARIIGETVRRRAATT